MYTNWLAMAMHMLPGIYNVFDSGCKSQADNILTKYT